MSEWKIVGVCISSLSAMTKFYRLHKQDVLICNGAVLPIWNRSLLSMYVPNHIGATWSNILGIDIEIPWGPCWVFVYGLKRRWQSRQDFQKIKGMEGRQVYSVVKRMNFKYASSPGGLVLLSKSVVLNQVLHQGKVMPGKIYTIWKGSN